MRNEPTILSRHATTVAWQGWRVDLPARWGPVKLEGDYDHGYALFADLHRPRLGIRWQTQRGKKFDAGECIHRALCDEVGKLAADEAVDHPGPGEAWVGSKLYTEPAPPGRDVWLGYSKSSSRLLEVIHHAHRRERMLADVILPTVVDLAAGEADEVPWSIFDLSFRLPGDWRLSSQHLNAGDLSLTFAKGRHVLTVRQIAVAELALQRQPLPRWLDQQGKSDQRFYRAQRASSDVLIESVGRTLTGLQRFMNRRLRYAFMRWLPASVVMFGLHDAMRDRLVFVKGTDDDVVKRTIPTIGWASE